MSDNKENDKANSIQYAQYLNSYGNISSDEITNKRETDAETEYDKFIAKLKVFENIKTVQEAKEQAKSLFHINQEISYIKAGNATCAIVSRADLLRIVVDSDKELICYNFKAEEKHNGQ